MQKNKWKGQEEQMSKLERLMRRIEEERRKLNQLIAEHDQEETYHQSLVVDGLVEEYIMLTDQ